MSSRKAYIRVLSVQFSTCTMALSKHSRYFLSVSVSLCFMPNKWDAPSFLVFEPRNAVAKEFASCLKQSIDLGTSHRYHCLTALVRVR